MDCGARVETWSPGGGCDDCPGRGWRCRVQGGAVEIGKVVRAGMFVDDGDSFWKDGVGQQHSIVR